MADYGVISARFPYVLTPGGRLTAVSGTPETLTDQLNVSTIYYSPYAHDILPLYNTTKQLWVPYRFGDLGIPLTGIAANKNCDVFLAANPAGGFFYQVLAWTSDTARASALGTLNGIYVLGSNAAYRYLGTIRTTGTAAQTEDSNINRFIWNAYNQVRRDMFRGDSGTGAGAVYTITSASTSGYNTIRTVRNLGAGANALNVVCGLTTDVWIQTAFQVNGNAYVYLYQNGSGIGDSAPMNVSNYCYLAQQTQKRIGATWNQFYAGEMAWQTSANFLYLGMRGWVRG